MPAEITDATDFLVSWSGVDEAGGSGLAGYDVYVSVDDGPYEIWLAQTVEDSALFSGEEGHTYAFYSCARDIAGNVEAAPASADAITEIPISNVPPVVDAGPDATVNEGETFGRTASFSDPDPDDSWTAAVDYGDGSGVQPLPLSGKTYELENIYVDEETYTVTVTVTDSYAESDTDQFVVTVLNVAPMVDAGEDQTANEGNTVSFSGSLHDPGLTDTHTIQWDFGDGSTISGILDPSHVYADNGVYTVMVTVTDDDGASTSDTLTVTVENVAPTVIAGTDQTVDEGSVVSLDPATFNDLGTLDTHTAVIDWGDGTSPDAGIVTESPFGPPGSTSGADGTVSGSHVYADDGIYTVTVTVTDDNNDSGSDTLTITVNEVNVPPVLADIEVTSLSYTENDGPVAITGTITVSDVDDTDLEVVTISISSGYVNGEDTLSFTDQLGITGSWDPVTGVLILLDTSSVANYQTALRSITYTNSSEDPDTTARTISFVVNDGDADSNTATRDITIDAVGPSQLRVDSLEVIPSGFIAHFNRQVESDVLNLYDTEAGIYGQADFTVVRNTVGPVAGSLIYNDEAKTVSFIKTGGPLEPDTYLVTLRSADNGFKDSEGHLLDGDADNIEGGDYVTTVTVEPTTAQLLSLPDFTRGPGQDVNVPAADSGIPVTISDGSDILTADFVFDYDPALLSVTGVSLASGLPSGWDLVYNLGTLGHVAVTVYGPTPLDAGEISLVEIEANVPEDAPYRSAAILSLSNIQINKGAILSRADSAVQVVAYFGDATGNHTYSGLDAAYIARVAVGLDSGFSAYRLKDPVIVADVTGNGRLSGLDAADVAQKAVGLEQPEIPDLPDPLPWYEEDQDDKPRLNRYYTEYDNPIAPNASSYTLPLDLGIVENYSSMNSKLDLQIVTPLLEQNGFAIIEYNLGEPNDIVEPYEKLRQMDVPIFITSDTLLHLYHVQFDETLKDIEEREFYNDIRDLTGQLLENALALYEQCTDDLREAAKRNMAYLAVAQKLVCPDAQVPELVADLVASEVAKIEAHSGFAASDIFVYEEDYSQYIPRGHYTRSEELKRYFKTLMWYGRMAFLLKGSENWGPAGEALISVHEARVQTMQAVLLARAIENVQVGQRSGREVWDRIYAITAFYVGLADDLTPYEYVEAVEKVFGSSFEPSDLENEDKFLALKIELALLPSPEIFGGTGNAMVIPPVTAETLNELLDKTKGMRFMGQRFIPDSYMFQHLVFPEVLDYTGNSDPKPFTYGSTGVRGARCYPRGLDVMAVLGSDRAKAILIEEGDTDYVDYELRFNELRAEFDALSLADWNRNLYWGWLYSLQALLFEFPEGYPNFMRTQTWEKKELNAALASWTELRHDTILYAKQSYTPIETGLPPAVKGYVEPVPEFYGRLLALTRMTREGLMDFGALSTQGEERLVNLENMLSQLIEIANKELTNEMLMEEDYEYIRNFGSILERVVLGVDEEGVSTTLVADVHTHSAEGKVLEEGVGYVELIIAACPLANGGAFLAAGPVLSYYEFKHPMNDRLTDEAWRELLKSPERPERPTWFQSLLDDTLIPDTGNGTPPIVDMGAYESLPDRIGPAVQDWTLAKDTGTDSADKLTNDTTLQLTSTFAGIIFGEDFNETSGDLSVDNISTSQFINEIAVLSNDFDGDIESKVGTTKKDDTSQLYVNYNEIGIEETTSIGVRGTHWAKLVLKTQYVSALKAKDRKLIRLILDEYVEKAQLSITLNISRLSLVLRSSQPE